MYIVRAMWSNKNTGVAEYEKYCIIYCNSFLWPPYGLGQTIIFLPCVYFFFFFFSLPNLSGRRLDVYRTSTHGVALVQI